MKSPISGVLPVFQTPFSEDESIDFDILKRELDWLISRGSHGVVMAMVSEVLRLAERERRELAEFVCGHVGVRWHRVISVGAESTHCAVELARHAEGCGASAVMAIPPISVAATDAELRGYFDRILSAISIPLIVQDASGYVGRPMSIEMQAGLCREAGDRVYFKPEAPPLGPRLSALLDATDGAARVFEGSGGITLVDCYRRGIVGTMPGADVVDAVVALWTAMTEGDGAAVDRIAPRLSMLVSMQGTLDSFLAVEKHLLYRQGVFRNEVVRGPREYVMDESTRREVDRLFDLLSAELRSM